MTKVQVDREGILLALNSSLEEVDWFLDLRTGDVVPHHALGTTDMEPGRDPTSDASRYQPIEPLSVADERSMRAAFAETVTDPGLRERLQQALAGPGAFRRFGHALAANPHEEERWSRFEEEQLLQAAREQLVQDGIEAEFVSRR